MWLLSVSIMVLLRISLCVSLRFVVRCLVLMLRLVMICVICVSVLFVRWVRLGSVFYLVC